ncbi:hypothetical protein NC652_010233 [Populus alba x Populus x berolinensis]|uniref:Uncharacterized protein n=1 Tax=Populus alba x Populus x berolinensis TaxID=444605 RepID=A0AAD6QZE1_9ROSI|nr:hypothetical protein NC652_010233 [Populus alba x Populus x berolinensis]KAJ6999520.1 hypothetical protein NC653_010278 [Populus alba x Populus x berolinensis]
MSRSIHDRVFSCAGFYNFEECDLANKREKEKKRKKYKDQDQIFYNSGLTSCLLDCTKLGKKEKRGRNVNCYSTNDTSLLIFPVNFIRSDLRSYFNNPNKQTVPSTISLQFHPFDSREFKLQGGKSVIFKLVLYSSAENLSFKGAKL